MHQLSSGRSGIFYFLSGFPSLSSGTFSFHRTGRWGGRRGLHACRQIGGNWMLWRGLLAASPLALASCTPWSGLKHRWCPALMPQPDCLGPQMRACRVACRHSARHPRSTVPWCWWSCEDSAVFCPTPSRLVYGSAVLSLRFANQTLPSPIFKVWLEAIGNLSILILGDLGAALWILILAALLWVLLYCSATKVTSEPCLQLSKSPQGGHGQHTTPRCRKGNRPPLHS